KLCSSSPWGVSCCLGIVAATFKLWLGELSRRFKSAATLFLVFSLARPPAWGPARASLFTRVFAVRSAGFLGRLILDIVQRHGMLIACQGQHGVHQLGVDLQDERAHHHLVECHVLFDRLEVLAFRTEVSQIEEPFFMIANRISET